MKLTKQQIENLLDSAKKNGVSFPEWWKANKHRFPDFKQWWK